MCIGPREENKRCAVKGKRLFFLDQPASQAHKEHTTTKEKEENKKKVGAQYAYQQAVSNQPSRTHTHTHMRVVTATCRPAQGLLGENTGKGCASLLNT